MGTPRSAVVRGVAALVLLGGVLRLPFVARPLSPDEAGYLMVGGQWGHGTSLYGDYWVDRPPLLVLLFRLAALAGGAVPLRLLGALAVLASVCLAGLLGWQVARSRGGALLTAATALVLLDAPLFGGLVVDGELLAVPFVLAGLCCLLRATDGAAPGSRGWWLLAGCCAAAAGLVKQNLLDVFVVAAVVLLWFFLRVGRRPAVVNGLVLGAGAVLTAALVLAIAWAHGTSPAGIWDAVVVFRGQASDVIEDEASPATGHRALLLALAWLGSAAPLLVGVSVVRSHDERRAGPRADLPLGWMSGALLAWEALGVVAGGSYWLHYLIGTVPGMVLLAARAVAAGAPVRRHVAALVCCAASVAATIGYVLVTGVPRTAGVPEMEAWLDAHARPGETGVVAWGHPEILANAGLVSPYRELWSLPVRVRDPELRELTRVLRSPDRPTWFVTRGPGLASWGIDASRVQPVLDARYVEVERFGEWRILHLR